MLAGILRLVRFLGTLVLGGQMALTLHLALEPLPFKPSMYTIRPGIEGSVPLGLARALLSPDPPVRSLERQIVPPLEALGGAAGYSLLLQGVRESEVSLLRIAGPIQRRAARSE